ncbi:hypothetical protein CA850_31480 [Micromonospora echinospora]|uniref:Uncharacterized protein n=1 Tax=Micromonospora echinospora TaxID=1877 RepID=A0A1C4WH56_MICEC|nr:hypothetical protein [Micromonospora echinospora]OZV73096.1 hypothetical protein CA850_31480 [Micromonospora echinospora]SCE95523.1 hypothetical protein GA0070618_2190 [Micromonospora echinospora]
MLIAGPIAQPDEPVVVEIDGLLWKPCPGATAAEFEAARSLFIEVHREARWNRWVETERAADLEAAMAVMGQWTRAEPGFRQTAPQEVEEWLASWKAEFEEEQADRERQRQARAAGYDEGRHHARLALLEQQSILTGRIAELTGLQDGTRFPAMEEQRRAAEIAKLDAEVAETEANIIALQREVGAPETVVDVNGWLPSQRRELALTNFIYWRCDEVQRLRAEVNRLTAEAESADQTQRRERRAEADRVRRKFDALRAMSPLAAKDMCPDCFSPATGHGWSFGEFDFPVGGPCPAWPRWAARLGRAREMLMSHQKRPEAVAAPNPQPLAVISSGKSIDEVIEELSRIRAEHPGAEVRRGNRNRWEIWPSRNTTPDTEKDR